jgi:hypothetical protein
MKPADAHRIDQALAAFAEVSAQVATMYKTLLAETGDSTVALELTKAWVTSTVIALHQRPPEAS